MAKNLTIGGKTASLYATAGTVLEIKQDRETKVEGQISGGGGGGAAYKGTGVVAGSSVRGSITSESIVHKELWIETDGGEELCFKWSHHDVPVRNGQNVSVVQLRNSNDASKICGIVNHTADRYWKMIQKHEVPGFIKAQVLQKPYGLGLAVLLGIGVILSMIADFSVMIPFGLAAGGLYVLAWKINYSRYDKEFRASLDDYCHELLGSNK